MINALLNETVQVRRRVSQGIDTLGNPTYGDPASGEGWFLVYPVMRARLAFSDEKIEFAPESERVLPYGTLYYQDIYDVLPEDRIITGQNIQYVVISTRIAYKTSSVVDHLEAVLALP